MIAQAILRWARGRSPDFIIGGNDRPYLVRWWLIPRNPILNIYVHTFLRSDDDRAHHDHPWLFRISWILEGMYSAHRIAEGGVSTETIRDAGSVEFCLGPSPHRIELVAGPCWTLFITGPRVRNWGFHCVNRWVPWQEFTATGNPGDIGRGCE